MSTNQLRKQPASFPLSEETLSRLLSVQEQKLALELKQADISLKELENNSKIADKSINAQLEDRKDARRCDIQRNRNMYWFAFAIVAAVCLFCLAAFYMGRENIVLDLAKIFVGFAGGFGFGYYRRGRLDQSKGED